MDQKIEGVSVQMVTLVISNSIKTLLLPNLVLKELVVASGNPSWLQKDTVTAGRAAECPESGAGSVASVAVASVAWRLHAGLA